MILLYFFVLECLQGEFMCDLTRCIAVSSRCDGLNDCDDRTDEQQCDSKKLDFSLKALLLTERFLGCSVHAFHCDKDKCIQQEKLCDNIPDCRDGTDELNCKGKCF